MDEINFHSVSDVFDRSFKKGNKTLRKTSSKKAFCMLSARFQFHEEKRKHDAVRTSTANGDLARGDAQRSVLCAQPGNRAHGRCEDGARDVP